MKLIVLHDKDGKIIAAAKHSGSKGGPVPVAAEGAEVTEIELKPEHAAMKLHHVCQKFRVHPDSAQLVEHDTTRKD